MHKGCFFKAAFIIILYINADYIYGIHIPARRQPACSYNFV